MKDSLLLSVHTHRQKRPTVHFLLHKCTFLPGSCPAQPQAANLGRWDLPAARNSSLSARLRFKKTPKNEKTNFHQSSGKLWAYTCKLSPGFSESLSAVIGAGCLAHGYFYCSWLLKVSSPFTTQDPLHSDGRSRESDVNGLHPNASKVGGSHLE